MIYSNFLTGRNKSTGKDFGMIPISIIVEEALNGDKNGEQG